MGSGVRNISNLLLDRWQMIEGLRENLWLNSSWLWIIDEWSAVLDASRIADSTSRLRHREI